MGTNNPERNSGRRLSQAGFSAILIVLILLTAAVFFVSICVGKFSVPLGDVVRLFLSKVGFHVPMTWDQRAEGVIFTLRLPRTLGALLVGGALSLSGSAYQGVFKNPLVAPDLLGVSSGACVGAAMAILLGLGAFGVQSLAFVLGVLTVGLTLLIPRLLRNTAMTMLVLSGVIVKGIMDSAMGIIKYLADPETQLASITYWLMGSMTKVTATDLLSVGPVIIVCTVVIILLRWRINILSLGDSEAKALGVNLKVTRGVIILCSTLLTASSVCICGTIGWVGLVIPHLSRIVAGQDNTRSIPASFFMGAVFMMLIDLLARNITSMELPLSILTGIIGAPFYIIVLSGQRMKLS